jgi:hypothetical protein
MSELRCLMKGSLRNQRALAAVNAKAESPRNTLQPQRLRRSWAGLIALALLSMLPLPASASILSSTAASAHQSTVCRYLTNGSLRICEFDTMEQCKATSSRCERYPFLAYCHFSPTGWVRRCDFDTLAECKAASSGFDGYCGRSPWLTTPEAPMPINQKQPYSKGRRLSNH